MKACSMRKKMTWSRYLLRTIKRGFADFIRSSRFPVSGVLHNTRLYRTAKLKFTLFKSGEFARIFLFNFNFFSDTKVKFTKANYKLRNLKTVFTY